MMIRLTRRKLIQLVGAAGVFLASGLASAGPQQAPSPDSPEFVEHVMRKLDDLYRGEQSRGIMVMKVKTKHWTRTMALESWAYGTEYSLIRILAPKKERGTASLKAERDLFTYLHKTGKTIKVTGAMMGASWMGSHFTNDDLVKGSRYSEDFDTEKTFSGSHNGVEIHRFTLIPKSNAAVVWGRITVDVRASDLQPLNQTFYDEDGNEVRLLEFSKYKKVGGRVLPSRMLMRPVDGSGEFTEVTWKKLSFDVQLHKSFFSLQRLKSL